MKTPFFQDHPDSRKEEFYEPSWIGTVTCQFFSAVLNDNKETVGPPEKDPFPVIGKKPYLMVLGK
jgi:hypothetical protein